MVENDVMRSPNLVENFVEMPLTISDIRTCLFHEMEATAILNYFKWYYPEYRKFRVLTEADNYRLQVSGYSGNAGYDAFGHQSGIMFTTYDRDNDQRSSVNCAVRDGGGFWYRHCALCGVNTARNRGGFWWFGLPGDDDLQLSRMWLQCK